MCLSPPMSELPTIPEEVDHVTLTLSIVSTEIGVSFVSTDFISFDCTHLKSCSSCVTSPWPCDWCVYDNMCTHDNSSCQPGETVVIGENNTVGSGNKGQSYCPQLLATSERFFIPVNIPSGYSLLATNLPTEKTKVQSFECILRIDGVGIRVQTFFFNESYIICSAEEYMFNENILEKNVSVSVEWNGQYNIDDPTDTNVTLYKCSVNGGSCSRCLSEEATPSHLNCGWCGDDCNVIQSDVCQNNQFLSQNDTQLCSAPLITEFYPMSGPINAQTRLQITGTDLGVEFDDVLEIVIGDLACNLTDMDSFYQPGQSVSCMTGISTRLISGRIGITVRSGESTKTGESVAEFFYRDPIISGFSPTEGQVAGGTEITITGTDLNTGRNIEATFGEAQCNNLIIEDTIATCVTSSLQMNEQVSVFLTMTFDGVEKTFKDFTFTYYPNPIIDAIDRTVAIMSGGLNIKLTGQRFDVIQEPRIIVSSLTTNASDSELCNGTETLLICPTPSFPDDGISARRRRATNGVMTANLTFDFDGYIVDRGLIEYYPDPMYESFIEPNRIYESGNSRLEITGINLDLASTEDDIQVLLGPDGVCDVDDLEIDVLRCQLPNKKPQPGNINGTVEPGPTQDLPAVTVYHGNLVFYPGYVKYSTTSINIGAIVGAVIGTALLIFILVIIGAIIFRRSHQRLNKQVQVFEMLEKKIQDRVETAFHELQADMSEVEEQISHLGVPFVNALDYSTNMLFAGLAVLPPTTDPEYMNSDLETAMIMFSRQLGNTDFLTNFIKQLEEQRKPKRRDRVNIASLITALLVTEGKFGYFTETLFKLLEESIEEGAESGRARSLFRRTETIVEKLLSNWISLCMYQYLKRQVAESLYLLYQSIKMQVEKGPIDITTGQSVFSLNFECLLEEEVEFNELTLSVVGRDRHHKYYVKVLDVDCMTQVKQKILDAAYRNSHIVQQNRAHEMDLLWYHPGGEERILKDRDELNKTIGNTKGLFINTIKTYGVSDGCQVALIVKSSMNETGTYQPVTPGVQLFQQYQEHAGPDDVRDRDYIRIRTMESGGSRIMHLVAENQIPTESSTSLTKLDREFLAPRLLVTKKTIQTRLDEFLACIFKKPGETPLTIKYLFDFFDKMANKYCDEKPEEIAEAWKSNSLPLHYWMTTLTHPSYVFDMRQSRSADQSVSVLANMLDNACKKIRSENTQESALNRVLFYRDLPGHIRTIGEYYENIKGLPPPTTEELQEDFNRITQDFSGLFSRVATLNKLYDFTSHDTGPLLDSITELMPN
ncbi:plexin-B1 [Strongylocentrotus purpuratus]|uniref:Uncharacterized protein n=1 Tax=Strongylocentrotus purpuratus TaxID=7668 RepID=A0A7M7NSV6_STRPU|nr:plexin-B1 [Strongylocentrotus purpuratus]